MNALRKYREGMRPKMSQAALAVKMKTQPPQISRWERWGDPTAPDARQIPIYYAIQAAKILGCRPIELRPDLQALRSLDLVLEGAPETIVDRIWKLVREELERG